MSRYRLRYATRCAAACIASLAAILLLRPAHAGEVITRSCLNGSGESHSSGYGNGFSEQYGSDHGDLYGSSYSYTRPDSFHFGRGGFRFRRGFFVTGATDNNGGGGISGGDAGSSNGFRSGSSNGYDVGSRSTYGSESCVEIRRDLTNPYVIQIRPLHAEGTDKEAEEHDRLWRARCRPVARQDGYGVNRYVYAAPGCEYGRYE